MEFVIIQLGLSFCVVINSINYTQPENWFQIKFTNCIKQGTNGMKTGTNCIWGEVENEGLVRKGEKNEVRLAPDWEVLGSWLGGFEVETIKLGEIEFLWRI